ncbi:hypothetical protein IQ276_011825 [Desmonostoc muscorum LEGE 12446]|nr:hypothetical protein [Desmonostoc muscorum]MCF2147124.1 hypothetical protein [Desmonostoc muscorum LEGE 12446]
MITIRDRNCSAGWVGGNIYREYPNELYACQFSGTYLLMDKLNVPDLLVAEYEV